MLYTHCICFESFRRLSNTLKCYYMHAVSMGNLFDRVKSNIDILNVQFSMYSYGLKMDVCYTCLLNSTLFK